jgi:hypothetical protein
LAASFILASLLEAPFLSLETFANLDGTLASMIPTGVSMGKFAIGEKVDNAADDHEVGTVIAVFSTVEGTLRYAVDMEGYGALQFFAEEKLVVHP